MAKKKGFKIPGVSFSAKRALGISAAKSKLSRQIGIPLTKAGRQKKLGKAMGCSVMIVPVISLIIVSAIYIKNAIT